MFPWNANYVKLTEKSTMEHYPWNDRFVKILMNLENLIVSLLICPFSKDFNEFWFNLTGTDRTTGHLSPNAETASNEYP